MQALVERIENEATYLGRGIIKVDGFINHQLDPQLTAEMGLAFAARFRAAGVKGVTKIVTAEVSGIAPALATGAAFSVPVVFARKKVPVTMGAGVFSAETPSRTKGNLVTLRISPDYLHSHDRVLIIDDFLATGQTLQALVAIIRQSGATLLGMGCVIEKTFEHGRTHLADLNLPLITLAKIAIDQDNQLHVSE